MNINNPKLLWQLTFEGAWPTAVAFFGSGRKLAAANQRGDLYLWDLPETPPPFEPDEAAKRSQRQAPNHWPARRLEGHTNGITRLAATADGTQLLSAGLDHTIRIWQPDAPAAGTAEAILDSDARESEARRTKKDDALKAPGVPVELVTSSHVLREPQARSTTDGNALTDGQNSSSLARGACEHTDWILSLGISRDGRRLISGDMACRVIVWDLAERKPLSSWSGLPWNWIVAAALSADGQTALVSEYRYKRDDFDIPAAAVRSYSADGQEKLDILKTMFPKYDPQDSSYGAAQIWRKFVKEGLVAADFSPDGSLIALGQGGETDTGKVQLVETATGKLVREVSGHQYGVTDVCFSADGKYVLSTGRDTTLRICQVEDGKEVAALGSPRGGQFKDWLSALAISPDEKTVAAADIAGLVHVWSLEG
jgi:WD40 repeat protein